MRDTIQAVILAALLAFFLSVSAVSCRKQVPLGQPVFVRSIGDGPIFSYTQVGAVYHLLVKDNAGREAGMKKICGREICTIERAGELYIVRMEAR